MCQWHKHGYMDFCVDECVMCWGVWVVWMECILTCMQGIGHTCGCRLEVYVVGKSRKVSWQSRCWKFQGKGQLELGRWTGKKGGENAPTKRTRIPPVTRDRCIHYHY